MTTHPIRFLIHPTQEAGKYAVVAERLFRAARDEPDTFTIVVGEPMQEDHVAYHDSTLASTVLVDEYGTSYQRLTIRPGLHPVFDDLLAIMIDPDLN